MNPHAGSPATKTARPGERNARGAVSSLILPASTNMGR